LEEPALLLSGATGTLALDAGVQGPDQAPRIRAKLRGSGLGLENYSLGHLTGDLDLDWRDQGTVRLTVDARALSEGNRPVLSRMTAQLEGTLAEHRLQVSTEGDDWRTGTRLHGGLALAEPRWRGRLEELQFAAGDLGQWNLNAPADLMLGAGQARLGQSCLSRDGGAGRLCLDGYWESGGGAIGATLADLPLSVLDPDVSGTLGLDASASAARDGRLQGRASGRITPGSIGLRLGAREQSFAHAGGELEADLGDGGLSVRLELRPLPDGRIWGMLEIPGLHYLPPDPSLGLTGRLQARLPDLAPLQALTPELSHTAGRLDADLTLGGSLARPRLGGDLMLTGGAADVPLAGLALRKVELRAHTLQDDPDLLRLTGGVSSGTGRIRIEGESNWRRQNARVTLAGDDFQAFNTPDLRARIAPDLALDWDQGLLKVRGSLVIPEAQITPQIALADRITGMGAERTARPGSAVAPSADVVIVTPGRAAAPPPKAPRLPIDGEVDVILGREVQVSAVGFRSGISGAVRLVSKPGQTDVVPRAQGALELVDGRFRSFGQDLEIERGRILFDRVPVTDPSLDIRAVRWIKGDDRVETVGLQVTGTLEATKTSLFSVPPVDDETIESYLLTGRAPDSGERILSVGTHLRDDLYVGYGVNLLQGTHEFNLRYDILRWLGLEADVGEADNAINFSYKLER
jgi:autotransporter translocation and assembly factor TamB